MSTTETKSGTCWVWMMRAGAQAVISVAAASLSSTLDMRGGTRDSEVACADPAAGPEPHARSHDRKHERGEHRDGRSERPAGPTADRHSDQCEQLCHGAIPPESSANL